MISLNRIWYQNYDGDDDSDNDDDNDNNDDVNDDDDDDDDVFSKNVFFCRIIIVVALPEWTKVFKSFSST